MIYTFVIDETTELLSFDSVTNFSEKQSAQVSTYTTENGFPINDNIVFNNPKFSLSGVLSYYNSIDREIILVNGVFQLSENSEPDLSPADLEKTVRDIYLSKTPFDIVKSTDINDIFGTEVDRIKYCVISDLDFPYSSTQHGAVFPQMQITQLTVATVVEEVVPNATPQLIPKSKVATNEDVAQSKLDADTAANASSPDGVKSGDPNLGKKAYENDPEAVKALAKRQGVVESNMNYAQAIRERARRISEGASPSSLWVSPTGNGGWAVRTKNDYYTGR